MSSISSINLIRYLIVWRVNRPLVRLPRYLPIELSRVLGTLITERLPTKEARPWCKAMARWENYDEASTKNVQATDIAWPIETVLFVYPGKQFYGQGELLMWELKLMGNSADHGYLIEVILPAMEDASKTSDPRWNRKNSLWGRFDIQAIYAARGTQWEPIVQDGKLDLRYRASPTQWSDGVTFSVRSEQTMDHLVWITPFDLHTTQDTPSTMNQAVPHLSDFLEALAQRMSVFILGKNRADIWDVLNKYDKTALHNAIEEAAQIPLLKQNIEPSPPGWPGRWMGSQNFLNIPALLIPYLGLASVLHIGRQTHFGCGTFFLESRDLRRPRP